MLACSISSWGAQNKYKAIGARFSRKTLKRVVPRTEMYSNVITETDATTESDTSQNTNSLISSGDFIENYFEDDSDKENNSTNNIDAILESSEDKVKTLAQRTNGLMLVPF